MERIPEIDEVRKDISTIYNDGNITDSYNRLVYHLEEYPDVTYAEIMEKWSIHIKHYFIF